MDCPEPSIDGDASLRHCPDGAASGEWRAAAPDAMRRRLLVGAITSAAASLLAGAELAGPTPAAARSKLSPEAAL